jgi:hypothetical protein
MPGTEKTRIKINSGQSAPFAITIREAGRVIVPDETAWTLMDGAGNIINNREDVPATPAETTVVLLTPADTLVTTGKDELRILTMTLTYTSRLIDDGGLAVADVDDEVDETLQSELENSIAAEYAGGQLTLVKQWQFVTKYIKAPAVEP